MRPLMPRLIQLASMPRLSRMKPTPWQVELPPSSMWQGGLVGAWADHGVKLEFDLSSPPKHSEQHKAVSIFLY
jgi:hypothetical protein